MEALFPVREDLVPNSWSHFLFIGLALRERGLDPLGYCLLILSCFSSYYSPVSGSRSSLPSFRRVMPHALTDLRLLDDSQVDFEEPINVPLDFRMLILLALRCSSSSHFRKHVV